MKVLEPMPDLALPCRCCCEEAQAERQWRELREAIGQLAALVIRTGDAQRMGVWTVARLEAELTYRLDLLHGPRRTPQTESPSAHPDATTGSAAGDRVAPPPE